MGLCRRVLAPHFTVLHSTWARESESTCTCSYTGKTATRLLGSPFDSAWCSVCELCRLAVAWVDRRCSLSFVFLGGARRLGLSLCNTEKNSCSERISLTPYQPSSTQQPTLKATLAHQTKPHHDDATQKKQKPNIQPDI